jgi:hypothetical protein
VTVRALAGLAALNLAYVLVGLSFLWGVRGFRTWGAVLRLTGLGYLLGVAAFGVAWTALLAAGVPFGGLQVVVSLVALAVAGVAVGLLRGSPVPRGLALPRGTPMLLVSAAGIALTGLFLEALFRAARLHSLQAYDAWAFWVAKGKAIFFFGSLDEHVFTTTPNATYPPLQPILDAAAFHAIGGADVVTLHVQFWFLVVGAVAAIAGLLHRHAPPWLLWPSLLLVLVVPRFGERLLVPQADMLVDVFVVVAALLLALWLRDRAGWRLVAAAVLLAGAVNTKREGILFAAAVLAVAFVVSRPRDWARLAIASLAVGLAILPWRLWAASHDLPSGTPTSFGGDRLADAIRLSFEVLYSTARWSVVPLVATIALVAAAVWGDRRLAAFVALVSLLLFAGGVWSTVGFEELALTADESGNPIVRYTGSIILLAAVAVPLLLCSVWRRGEEP